MYKQFGLKKKIESIPTPAFTVVILIWVVFILLAVPLILSLVPR